MKRRGDLGVGRMKLAFDGDALDAEAGGNGELLDATAKRVEKPLRLAADPGAVEERARKKEHADEKPFAPHAIAVELAEANGFRASGDEAAGAGKHGKAARG